MTTNEGSQADGDLAKRVMPPADSYARASGGMASAADLENADTVPQPVLDLGTYGQSGLRQSGGYLDEEFLKELKGKKARMVYRQMGDNDATVGAILFVLRTLVESVEWSVVPADDSTPAAAEAEFLESVLEDMEMPMESVLSTISTMFQYGFAPLEKLYKIRKGPDEDDARYRSDYTDGLVGLRGLALRAQQTVERWDIEPETGRILGMWQQPYTGVQRYIPIEKLALFRTTDDKNNPEGRSLLRNAYRSWYFKTRLEELEAIGIERELAGLPLIRIPAQYLDTQGDPAMRRVGATFRQMAKNIKRDQEEGLVIPSDLYPNGGKMFDVELLGGKGTGRVDTTKVIERHDKAMATSVLADFIFLGQQAVGSFALSNDKTALFSQALEAFLGMIAGVWNSDIIPTLWKLNGKDAKLRPRLEHGKIERANLAELAAFITALANAGMALFPDRELENTLRRAGNLPEAPEESGDMPDTPPIPIVGPLAAPPAGAGDAEGGGDPSADAGGAAGANANPEAEAKPDPEADPAAP